MGKKNNHSSPAAAESSETEAIDNLKNLNDQLVKEVAECLKQIEQLQFQLSALASHHNILLEQSRKIEDAERHGARKWKKWICSAAVATASFCVVAAVVTLCCSKSSNPKN
ncbi:hypothetical protein MA16_Dca009009 [Dendrobium catenatum]|uniref:Uncharacterized protein n=1 Tax=Dendrobium catenatum TaxID=906689 RepID=A0A2I0VR96_9ASPA|nr:hypothetical protein MA16_Dca009009 [Dendrobium catenatum]